MDNIHSLFDRHSCHKTAVHTLDVLLLLLFVVLWAFLAESFMTLCLKNNRSAWQNALGLIQLLTTDKFIAD